MVCSDIFGCLSLFVSMVFFFFFFLGLFHNNTAERMYTEPCMTIDTADIATCNSADCLCMCVFVLIGSLCNMGHYLAVDENIILPLYEVWRLF